MAVMKLTEEMYQKEVMETDKKVVIDFWADWCGPCKMMAPVVEELADELEGQVKVGKVNVDEEAALALKYQIMSIPTLIVMKKGVFQNKAIGVQTKEAVLELLK